VLQNLIPLLLKTAGGEERSQKIALACTDLLTSITWPVDANAEVREAITRGESTEDLSHLFALERDMVKYKAAVLRQRSGESQQKSGSREILNCIMRYILLPALSKPRHHRNERDVGTISMSLHFFRNLLAIQDPVATTLSSVEQISNSTLQSELICTMARSHVLETILMLANSAESREFGQWNAITLECVYAIFGGEEVAVIAGSSTGVISDAPADTATSKEPGKAAPPPRTISKNAALASSLNSEAHQRRVALAASGSSRHSRFGTSISFFTADGDVRVARNAASLRKSVEELRQDNVLRAKRKFRRRKRAREEGAPRVKSAWTSAAKEVLKGWADRFLLSSGFETLTRSCLNDIRSEREKVGDLDQARVRVMTVGVFFLDYFLVRRAEESNRVAAKEATAKGTGSGRTAISGPLTPVQRQPQLQETVGSIEPSLDKGKGKATEATVVQEQQEHFGAEDSYQGTELDAEAGEPAAANIGEAQQVTEGATAVTEAEVAPPDWSFSLLSDWFKPWAFKMVLVRTDSALDSKGWLEMTASLQLWMSLLRLIDALSQSAVEEEKDLAENLQANHFYHSETLELCVKISRSFTTQSFEFLRCVVAFACIMPKMLERYSLNKEHIFVRAKRHARKAKEKANQATDDDPDAEEQDPDAKAQVIYTERRFNFDRFQNKLCCRPLVEACVAYLGRWRDYQRPADELANVVAVMHRIAIKANDARSFFPAHIRVAFQAILKGPLVAAMLPRAPRAVNDTKKLIEFVLKKYEKLSKEEKELWTFGKAPPRPQKAIKLPREIEVKPGMNRDDQVGIAVGLLAERGMIARITWIKGALEIASAERLGTVLSIDGNRMWSATKRAMEEAGDDTGPSNEERDAMNETLLSAIPSDEAVNSFEPYELPYDGDSELQRDASTSPPLKLLARLMGLESDESDPDHWRWRVPDNILPTHLDADIQLIEDRLQSPLEIHGSSYEEYVQNARKKRVAKAKQLAPADLGQSDDESNSGSDSGSVSSGSSSAPRKRKTTRRRDDLKGDERKKKKAFKRRKIETGPLFLQDDIIDSDEDEQVDALWRARNGAKSPSPASRPKAKLRTTTSDIDSEMDSEGEMEDRISPPRVSNVSQLRRATSEASDTPPTSPPTYHAPRDKPARSARRSEALFLSSSDEDSDGGDNDDDNQSDGSTGIREYSYSAESPQRADGDDLTLKRAKARNALLAAMMDSDEE
jgi:replication fork protection complex subunit Tof1/Swi1